MITYDQPFRKTYTIPASAIDTAGVKLQIVGPKGLQGRLSDISAVITVDTTVAVTSIEVGTVADADKFGTLSVPIGVAGVLANAFVDLTTDDNLIPADTVVEISSDGGATAGDADLSVTIDWF